MTPSVESGGRNIPVNRQFSTYRKGRCLCPTGMKGSAVCLALLGHSSWIMKLHLMGFTEPETGSQLVEISRTILVQFRYNSKGSGNLLHFLLPPKSLALESQPTAAAAKPELPQSDFVINLHRGSFSLWPIPGTAPGPFAFLRKMGKGMVPFCSRCQIIPVRYI